MRKFALITLLALGLTMVATGIAFAHGTDSEVDSILPDKTASNSLGCTDCHPAKPREVYGPHGGYATGTNKCALCHTVHSAKSASLLPGATVTAACNYCHDLTHTKLAPYTMVGGGTVKAAHRVVDVQFANDWNFKDLSSGDINVHGNVYASPTGDEKGALDVTTATVPGASNTDGSTGTLTTNAGGAKLSGNLFTCDSCHTPHAMTGSTVNEYLGESYVKDVNSTYNSTTHVTTDWSAGEYKIYMSNRLLRKSINGNTAADYGSAWCALCHAGRSPHQMGSVYNHPVNAAAKYDLFGMYGGDVLDGTGASIGNGSKASAIYNDGVYQVVYVDGDPTTGTLTGKTALASDPRTNKYYAMTATDVMTSKAFQDGSVAYASGTGPSCQQCHASPRNVTEKWADTGRPGSLNFPHVSTNKALLIESGDDFCTNCHGLNLP